MSGEDEGNGRVTYADIFGEREFRYLFISRALSTVGDYIARAALVISVFHDTGSTALMGITFALTTLPDLMGGPILAGLADRYPRRNVMVIVDWARAALLLFMAVPGMPLWSLWALLFVVRLMDSPFQSAYIATMSVVLPGKRLVKGSAVTQLVNHLSYTVGYGLGGLIVSLTGLSLVLVFNAATFSMSAIAILVGVLYRPATAAADAPRSLLGSFRAATHYIFNHPRLRIIILFPFAIAATLATETLAAPYATEVSQGPAVAGLLMGSGPAGIVIGLWLMPMLIPDPRTGHIVVLTITSCAPLALFFFVPGPVVASLLIIVSGIALYYWIPLSTEFTQSTPDSMRGQAVGLMLTMMRLTQGFAILGFGLAAGHTSSSSVIAISGALGTVFVICVSMAWVWVNRTEKVGVTPSAAPGTNPTPGEATP